MTSTKSYLRQIWHQNVFHFLCAFSWSYLATLVTAVRLTKMDAKNSSAVELISPAWTLDMPTWFLVSKGKWVCLCGWGYSRRRDKFHSWWILGKYDPSFCIFVQFRVDNALLLLGKFWICWLSPFLFWRGTAVDDIYCMLNFKWTKILNVAQYDTGFCRGVTKLTETDEVYAKNYFSTSSEYDIQFTTLTGNIIRRKEQNSFTLRWKQWWIYGDARDIA